MYADDLLLLVFFGAVTLVSCVHNLVLMKVACSAETLPTLLALVKLLFRVTCLHLNGCPVRLFMCFSKAGSFEKYLIVQKNTYSTNIPCI